MERQRGREPEDELADDRRERDEHARPKEGLPEVVAGEEPAVVRQADHLGVQGARTREPPIGEAQPDRPHDGRHDEDPEEDEGGCQEADDDQVLTEPVGSTSDHRAAAEVIGSADSRG